MRLTAWHLAEALTYLADQAAEQKDSKAVMDLITARNYVRFDAGLEDNDVVIEFT